MAIIDNEDRIEDFEELKEAFDAVGIVSKVIDKGDLVGEPCMMIALPTEDDADLSDEGENADLHLAAAYLTQLSRSEKQMTKYLMLYAQVKTDLEGMEEGRILSLVNRMNQEQMLITFIYGKARPEEPCTVQLKCTVGALDDEYPDEALVCEAVVEMGAAYDRMKQELREL